MSAPDAAASIRPDAGVGAHADWELPEVLAAVILLAFVVLTVTGVVSGVVAGVGAESPQLTGTQLVGLSIQDATSWADPPLAFVLVSSMWLVWWQVRIWSAEIALADEAGDVEDSDGDSPVLIAAFDHLLRAKTLASWALPLFLVVLTAAAVGVAGSFLLYRGPLVGASGTLWSNHLETLGFAVATWVLAGAGLVAAVYVRTQVSYEFTLAEEAATEAQRRAAALGRGATPAEAAPHDRITGVGGGAGTPAGDDPGPEPPATDPDATPGP